MVFGAETHVVWDKFAKYFDVEMRKIPMQPDRFVLSAEDVEAHVDENTIAVGAVLGTTHIGEADPIEEINDLLVRIKAEKGWDIPIHVDGASGAFIAPFAHPAFEFDFRLEQVASINVSGHKYGLVYPGVGWLIFRDRSKLPEELVFSVNYLGGAQPTYTFNFSRGSAMIQAQAYNFLRLGRDGLHRDRPERCSPTPATSTSSSRRAGKFEILNPDLAEPVVTFKIKGDPGFDVYHLSARLRENGWIVPAYSLPPDAEDVHLMRVVVRIDLSRRMIDLLLLDLLQAWDELEAEQPPARVAPRPDVWTHPEHAAGHSKRRSHQTALSLASARSRTLHGHSEGAVPWARSSTRASRSDATLEFVDGDDNHPMSTCAPPTSGPSRPRPPSPRTGTRRSGEFRPRGSGTRRRPAPRRG